MVLKISDIQLDLAAGDASPFDPYIAQAKGIVRSSKQYFEYAQLVEELNIVQEGNVEDFDVIQEAAESEGLPTDAAGGCALGCDSVKTGMMGLFDLVSATSKKVKAETTKDMRLLLGLGKSVGVNTSTDTANFKTDFAEPFAASLLKEIGGTGVFKNKVQLADGASFLKGNVADKIAKNYVKGMTSLIHAYGFSISDVFADDVIAKTYEKSFVKAGEVSSFKAAIDAIDDGTALVKFDAIAKEKHYTNAPTDSDIQSFCVALYVILAVSSAVVDVIGKAKKTAQANVNSLCSGEDCSKKMSKSIKSFGENMSDYSDTVSGVTESIVKGFNDSIYSLTNTFKGEK